MARPNWVSAPVPYDWRQECWQILLATGADPDGDDARHLNPGEALRAVEELRREAEGEGATLGSMVDALIAVIDSGAHPAEDAAIVVGQLIRWREAKYPEADRSADACEAAADAGITTPDPAHNPANPRSDGARGEPHTRAQNAEGS